MVKMASYRIKPSNKSVNDEIVEHLQAVGCECKRDEVNTPYATIDGNKRYFTTFTTYGICNIYAITPELFNILYASNKNAE